MAVPTALDKKAIAKRGEAKYGRAPTKAAIDATYAKNVAEIRARAMAKAKVTPATPATKVAGSPATPATPASPSRVERPMVNTQYLTPDQRAEKQAAWVAAHPSGTAPGQMSPRAPERVRPAPPANRPVSPAATRRAERAVAPAVPRPRRRVRPAFPRNG